MVIYTMKELLKDLPTEYLRIHNSFIVPIRNMSKIENGEMYLFKGKQTILPIGGTYKEEILKRLGIIKEDKND